MNLFDCYKLSKMLWVLLMLSKFLRKIKNLGAIYIHFLDFKYRKNVRFLQGSSVDIKTQLEGRNSLGENTKLLNCNIGFGSYTGKDVSFYHVKIGRFCSIASCVKNIYGNHPMKCFSSTHPAFYSTRKQAGYTYADENLFDEVTTTDSGWVNEIGNDVWIGEDVAIMGGVSIGDGAVVGARSLVTKDVKPYEIVVGTPAKSIGFRFDEDIVEGLCKSEWWDLSESELTKLLPDMANPKRFITEVAAVRCKQ